MNNLTSININFDSLKWGFSITNKNFIDPAFFHIADRFFEFSKLYDFKYTIFVIGQDLTHPAVAERVKFWSGQGHEIGNHSYSHPQNLGSLSYNEIEQEVLKTHEIITRLCGKEPRGFIAPSWATSINLIKILLKNGYLYDTSLVPSYVLWFAVVQNWWNFKGDSRRKDILQRKDRLANLAGSRQPYFANESSLTIKQKEGLLILPLPVTPLLRLPCWHTMKFLIPKSMFQYILKSCLSNLDHFYYLTHPMDLTDLTDIPNKYRTTKTMHRMEIPLDKKKELFGESIKTIVDHSNRIVTMERLAQIISTSKKN